MAASSTIFPGLVLTSTPSMVMVIASVFSTILPFPLFESTR